MSVDEFHGHLDSQATKFSERVFSILDQDMSGMLDLREFIIGVWNYCTYDTTLVAKVRYGGASLILLRLAPSASSARQTLFFASRALVHTHCSSP